MNIKVLLIEDNPDDATVYKLLLEKEGYAVEVATNGMDGLDRGKSGDFDVVLTDLNLGRKWDEGRDLVAHLRSANPRLPVILMTGGHTADIAIDVIKVAHGILPVPHVGDESKDDHLSLTTKEIL